jgi:regulatory helix-turn-helix LysR family protein
MDFRDLEYFAAVAKHRHVGRAAESIGLSQPALSLSLRRLEKSIQAKVVKRAPKGVELTAVGSALLSHVRRLLLARNDVVREISDLGAGRSGHLQVGVEFACAPLYDGIQLDGCKTARDRVIRSAGIRLPRLRDAIHATLSPRNIAGERNIPDSRNRRLLS